MTKLPPALAFALVGVLALALGGAGWLIALGPERKKASDLSQQIADAQQQIDQAQAPPTPPSQRIRVADVFQLSRAMPDNVDLPDVLLQLSQTAAETGISFQSITPGTPSSAGQYATVPIELVFNGRFYDLSDFLYRLRNLVGVHQGTLSATGRLFSVESIMFGPGDGVQFPQVQARLTVNAYVYGNAIPSLPAALPSPSTDTSSTDTTSTDTTSTDTTTTPSSGTPSAVGVAPSLG